MGFFGGIKKAGGYVFNFRVDKWFGLDQFKSSSGQLVDEAKTIFVGEKASRTETFEQALQRLNVTEQELQARLKEFRRLLVVYLLVALVLFVYSTYIAYAYDNILGFFMGLAVTTYALSHAFKYHFWIFQITHKKLGCSLKEWFVGK